MKKRLGADGVHFFDRQSGLNVLFDEIKPERSDWSVAPRQVSIALTNLCDLQCRYCYAPKHKATLPATLVLQWVQELDRAGCLGIGFGGGEPTLHPQFDSICRQAAEKTGLAVTFTTHGHRLHKHLLDRIRGSVHFIRVSVDGVATNYESQRRRSYATLVRNLLLARTTAGIGINVVVNERTVGDLEKVSELAHDVGASELLLLPQRATSVVANAAETVMRELANWIESYSGAVRLAVGESSTDGLPICEPLPNEIGLRSYAHIDAMGLIKASSFEADGVAIDDDGVIAAAKRLADIRGEGL